MRGVDWPIGKALWRLREIEPVARYGLGHQFIAAGALQRLRHGQHRQSCLAFADAGNDPVDQRRVDERPGGVVDQHLLRIMVAQCREPKPHRVLSRCAAMRDSHLAGSGGGRGGKQIAVVRMDHHDDRADGRVCEEGVERPGDDRAAADAAVLLGPFGRLAGAFAAAGRDDHHGDLRGSMSSLGRRLDPCPRSIRA